MAKNHALVPFRAARILWTWAIIIAVVRSARRTTTPARPIPAPHPHAKGSIFGAPLERRTPAPLGPASGA